MTYGNVILKTGRQGFAAEVQTLAADLGDATRRAYLAFALARHDIAARYRGSIIGPFWITLSMAALIVGIGTLYSQIFKQDIASFLPFVALGFVVWSYLATTINEGCDTFVSAAPILRQSSLPMFTFVWRVVLRNLMILAHHLIIVVVILAWTGTSPVRVAQSLGGLLMVTAILAPLVILVAIVAARFRDVPQIIASVTQFAMFLTPVFWKPDQIGNNHFALRYNAFYYMLDVIRSPLLGHAVDPLAWPVLTGLLCVLWPLALVVFAATRRRVVHYL